MDEQYIKDLWSQLNPQYGLGSFQDFKDLISSDESYRKDFFNAVGENVLGSYDDFASLVSVKKKGVSELPSQPSQEDGFLGTAPTAPRVPSALSGEITEAELIDFMPFAPDDAVVKRYLPEDFESLSVNEKIKATGEALKQPGVKDVIESRINYQKIVEQDREERTQAAIDEDVKVESDYFTGEFGDFLKSMDSPMVGIGWMGLGEKIDDLGRAIATGLSQGDIVEETLPMAWGGSKTSDQDIDKYIAISKKMD
jgi:hypothetical protein